MTTDRYPTLWDVFPRLENRGQIAAQVEEVKEYLAGAGKTYCTPDEAIFLATLSRAITVFTKAKEMVANSRFTVVYRGPEYNDNPTVENFEIITLQPKKDATST